MLEVRVARHVGGQLLHERQQHVLAQLARRPEHGGRLGGAARTHHQRQVAGRQRELERAVHVARRHQRLDLRDLHLWGRRARYRGRSGGQRGALSGCFDPSDRGEGQHSNALVDKFILDCLDWSLENQKVVASVCLKTQIVSF